MPAAAPSPAAPGEIPVTIRPARRFLLTLAGVVALLTALLLAAATFTDPSRYFFGSPVPQIHPNVTRRKIELFRQYTAHEKVTGLLFGSSRSALLRPDEIDRATGLRFFNAAADDPTTDQYLAMYRLFRKIQGAPPKVLILGYETTLLSKGVTAYPDMAANYELNAELNPRLFRPWHYAKVYATYFRTQTILDLQTSLNNWKAPRRPISVYFPDGHAEGREFLADALNSRSRARLGSAMDVLLDRYREFSGISAERTARLRSLFEEASGDGVLILVWFTPLHPALREAVDRLPDAPGREQQSRDAARTLAGEFHGQVLDLSDPNSFAGDPDHWLDAVHVNPADSHREMARIVAALQN